MNLLRIVFFLSVVSFHLISSTQNFYSCITACKNSNNGQEWCKNSCKQKHWSELQAVFKKPECHKVCNDFGMPNEWCNDWSACGKTGLHKFKQESKKELKPKVLLQEMVKPIATTNTKKFNDKKLIAYYASWAIYGRKYPITSIPADKVTHINYAFAKTDTQGNILTIDPWADTEHRTDWSSDKAYWGNFRQLQDLKAKYPHLKTLISIGGWTLSNTFSDMAASAQARQNFARNATIFARKYGFDGIDIDWEYPGFAEHNGKPQDKQNFTLLLADLRNAINQDSQTSTIKQKLLLTIAAPAGRWHLKNIELDKIAQYLDWINIMTYDFHGPWKGEQDQVTNHNSPLYPSEIGDKTLNMQSTVEYFISKGIPSNKLVAGLALYGRSYAGIQSRSTNDGLFSSYSDSGSGTTEKGVRLFDDIKSNLLKSGYKRYWDSIAKVPYLYNTNTKEFVSYDDEESLALKAQYSKNKKLAGVMVWELDTNTDRALDAIIAQM